MKVQSVPFKNLRLFFFILKQLLFESDIKFGKNETKDLDSLLPLAFTSSKTFPLDGQEPRSRPVVNTFTNAEQDVTFAIF